MNRSQKLKVLEDIQNGIPVRFALLRHKTEILIEDKATGIYYLSDGTAITEEEKAKYLKSVIIVNDKETRTALNELCTIQKSIKNIEVN